MFFSPLLAYAHALAILISYECFWNDVLVVHGVAQLARVFSVGEIARGVAPFDGGFGVPFDDFCRAGPDLGAVIVIASY